ncbi:MAG: hypothetical protein ACOCYG_08095, partial [Spirochaetota bacterium]
MESQSAVTIRDILSYSFLSQPRFAPAGGGDDRLVAFRVHGAVYDDNRYATDLWLVRLSGDANGAAATHPVPTRLTACGRVGVYAWEDQHTVLFSSDRAGEDRRKREEGEQFTQFYRIQVTGGEAAPAFRTDFAVKDMRVLDDGRIILLGTYDHISVEDRKERKDAAVTVITEIPWWSNGAGFTTDTRQALWLRDADGAMTRLTGDDMAVDSFDVSERENAVLYAGLPYNDKRETRNELHLLDLATLKSVRLDDATLESASAEGGEAGVDDGRARPREYDRPTFTEPGRAVVLVNRMNRFGLNENPDFAEVDLKAGELRLLTDNLDRAVANTVGSDCRF